MSVGISVTDATTFGKAPHTEWCANADCYDPFSNPSFGMIEHLPNPIQTLQDIASSLKRNGYMILVITL